LTSTAVSPSCALEAVAQRAGRVNRRGRHPDGPVEFPVHAVDAALLALRTCPGPVISEETISAWLACAYATSWGRQWETVARQNRDMFSESFLTFTEPFHDRSEFAAKLDESFDTTDVLLRTDLDEFRDLATAPDGDPLLAAGLLIPIRWTQRAALHKAGRAAFDRGLGVCVIDAPYDRRTGLDLASPASRPVRRPSCERRRRSRAANRGLVDGPR
jgi:CRISPR-associated endonuclease/helicase Cas3